MMDPKQVLEDGSQLHPGCNYYAKGICTKCGWIENPISTIIEQAAADNSTRDGEPWFIKGANFVVEHFLTPERLQLAKATLDLDEAVRVIKAMGLQCRNIGMYGVMNIRPGECTCSNCNAKAFVERMKNENDSTNTKV